jgi:hypothetical protein
MTSDIMRWEQQLRELRGGSQELSAALLATAQELRETGAEPPADLLARLERYRLRFTALKEELVERFPAAGDAGSLDDLDAAVASQAEVLAALEVLEAAARLQHREVAGFPPLHRVCDQCQQVRRELLSASAMEMASALVEGRHPLAALVHLVRDGATLSDDRWEALQEAVAQQFGRELATAVVRGRLTESAA